MSKIRFKVRQRNKVKVLVGLALVLISGLSLWQINGYQKLLLQAEINQSLENFDRDYQQQLEQLASQLSKQLSQLKQEYQNQPEDFNSFEDFVHRHNTAFAQQANIEHIIGYDSNQTIVNSISVKPSTAQPHPLRRIQQQGTAATSWHLEVSDQGLILISTYIPWQINSLGIAYMEIAQALPLKLLSLKTNHHINSLLFLHRQDNSTAELYNDFEQTPAVISARLKHSPRPLKPLRFKLADKHHLATSYSFYDQRGQLALSHVAAFDISSLIQSQQVKLWWYFLLIPTLALLLFHLLFNHLNKVRLELDTSYKKLLGEVETRKSVEDRLIANKESLEKRITDRTQLLKQLNLQLENDLTERHKIEKALISSERRYRHLFDYSSDAMILMEPGKPNRYNSQAIQLLKIGSRDLLTPLSLTDIFSSSSVDERHISKNLDQIIHDRNNSEPLKFERKCKNLQGDIFFAELTISNIDPGRQKNLQHITLRDITEKKDAEQKIHNQAYQDSLTGLPNRSLFVDRLNQTIAYAQRNDYLGAILFLDLDNFKYINDSLGHAVGDSLLIEVAQRISGAVRAQDTVARFGGDEFVVLIPASFSNKQSACFKVETIAEKIRTVISQPFMLEEKEFHITPSIGATIFPETSAELEDIIKHADTAMYQAKAKGKNSICFFETSMQQAIDKRLHMERQMRQSLREQDFSLHYQPKLDQYGNIIGAEALCRWQDTQGNWVSPAEFIPIAEDSGVIIDLGNWVMTTAIKTLRQIQSRYAADFGMSVNVSPIQLRQSNVVEQLVELCTRLNVTPSTVTLEITENFLLQDSPDSETKLRRIKAHGFKISIDDFGTGYSSLSYLKDLSIDELKIDRSFIADIEKHIDNAAIVETIIAMSKHLKLDVVAEGVENEFQLQFLRSKGCSKYQGFYFSKALDQQHLFSYIQENQRQLETV